MQNNHKVKYLFFIIIFVSIVNGIFASGTSEHQSQALLFNQKRVSWPSAPDSAVFYECYIMKFIYRNEVKLVLLDQKIINESNSGVNEIILINNVMEIVINSGAEMLRQENIIYKCIVLYSNSMFGMAMVNLFQAEPITMQIGHNIGSYHLYNIIGESDHAIIEMYAKTLSDDLNNNLYFYFPQNKRSIIKLDYWQNYNNVSVLDGINLLNTFFNMEIAGIEEYSENIFRSFTEPEFYMPWFYIDEEYFNRNMNLLQIKDAARKQARDIFNTHYSTLSEYELLRL